MDIMEGFEIAWTPDQETSNGSNTARFMAQHGIGSYEELADRSRLDPEWFWKAVVGFLGLPFQRPWRAVRDTSRGHAWATWFVGSLFNLSVACVDRWAEDDSTRTAIRSEMETGEISEVTFGELLSEVSQLAGALRALGVSKGDAVAVYLPMSSQAVISLLAVARLGAIFIPVFSGYGIEAVAARLEDPKPRVLVCADGFVRRGKVINSKEVADAAADSVGGIRSMLVVPYVGRDDAPMTADRDVWWDDVVPRSELAAAEATSSEDPVLLAYTSGTTGRPKGAVHVQAGLTVKVAEEGAFQTELTRDDTLMWSTDMGWIMGPWMVIAGLANGAAIATYDGAPDYPGADRIWSVVENLGITVLGLSPTLVRALQPFGAEQAHKHDLSKLRAFGSTGEPWNPDPWWWLFKDVGGSTRPILNIAGGTEIGACLLSANILQGIKPTSVGSPSLGIDADVFDQDGNSLRGEVGELVVRGSWPGMTRGFWKEPDRYLATYWSRFDNIWVHGDWASVDSDGFWYLHGRSDDTLNIAGKRIGPAEFESAVVSAPEIVMAAAVGIPDDIKGEAVALFVVPAQGVEPDDALRDRLFDLLDTALGKAFRPKTIRWVPDLPRTRSAKIMRRVVKALAIGEEPGDLSSLENPESLDGIGRI